jgi:HAD superfamily hydrolase (TIGR01509 family)
VELVLEEIAAGCAVMPGASKLLDGLRARGIPLGLASNSPRRVLDAALACTIDRHTFDVIVTADDVAHPKPYPHLYRRACKALSADPGQSVAFEDSPTGLAAAAGAGMFVVYVPSSPTSEQLQGADRTFGSSDASELKRCLLQIGIRV